MARDEYLESFGYDAVRDGMMMSNMVPQQNRSPARNHDIWGTIEYAHRQIVGDQSAGIPVIWVISGSIFDDQDGGEVQFVGEGIGVPDATYKLIAWFTPQDAYRCVALIIPQEASDFDLSTYLVSVDAVETRNGRFMSSGSVPLSPPAATPSHPFSICRQQRLHVEHIARLFRRRRPVCGGDQRFLQRPLYRPGERVHSYRNRRVGRHADRRAIRLQIKL
jgi:hypothetical protein